MLKNDQAYFNSTSKIFTVCLANFQRQMLEYFLTFFTKQNSELWQVWNIGLEQRASGSLIFPKTQSVPANSYLFKVNKKTLEKGEKYLSKTNNKDTRMTSMVSRIFSGNFEHISETQFHVLQEMAATELNSTIWKTFFALSDLKRS